MIFGRWNLLLLDILRVSLAVNLAAIEKEQEPEEFTHLCLGTIIDNSHLLTPCSCLKPEIESIIQGKKTDKSKFYFRLLESANRHRVVDIIPYKYCKTNEVFPMATDDFAIIKFAEEEIVRTDKIVESWPVYYSNYDFENLIDLFEGEESSVEVWSAKSDSVLIFSGVLKSRYDCRELLLCSSPNIILPFICNHFEDGLANFRCVHLSGSKCDDSMLGAPVIINDVIWGLSVKCVRDVNIYLALDRGFEFVYEKIKIYRSTDSMFLTYLSLGIVLTLIVVIVAAIVITIYIRHKNLPPYGYY